MLAPVQVLVVAIPNEDGARTAVEALAAGLAEGPVRWLDSFEVAAGPDGELVIAADDVGTPSVQLFTDTVGAAPVAGDDATWHLGDVVPPESRAVVVLLEHRWATGLRDSMRAVGSGLRFETWLGDEDRARLETLLDAG